jgi:integrase
MSAVVTVPKPRARRARRPQGSIIEIKGARVETYKLKFELPGALPGKRRTAYKTVKGTRKDAQRELRNLLSAAEKGIYVSDAKQPFSTWSKTWLQDHVRDEVSTRTFERYSELLNKHAVPYLGSLALGQVSPLQVQNLYRTLATSGWQPPARRPGEPLPPARGLSPRTVNHVHRVLFACFKDAVRLRILERNPLADVKKRKLKAASPTAERLPRTQMKILAPGQLRELLDGFEAAAPKNAPFPFVLLAIDTGGRRGELLALRWCDIDTDRRRVTFAQAVDETKTNGVTIKPDLKNESSRRTVTVSARTAAVLSAERERQAAVQKTLGRELTPTALAFPATPEHPDKPIRPREATKAFVRRARALGFAGLRLHDLRHNCASHMLAAGRPVTAVAAHLGHATPAVTMAVYAHHIPATNDAGAGLLDSLLPSGG